jgi:MYXO-CTERM domain-containing protein
VHESTGHRHWLWESGAEYRVVDAFGDVGDYAGGVVHVLGVEDSRTRDASLGVPIALFPPAGRTLAADTRFAVTQAGFGFAYLTAPEPSGAALALAAIAALAAIERRRRAR